MIRTENSITILANIDDVFQVANDLENWPNLLPPCQGIKILKREGNKTTFEITVLVHSKLMKWCSTRIVDNEKKRTKAQREYPKFPFRNMIIEWVFEETKEGTKLTFIHNFNMAIPLIGWLIGKLFITRLLHKTSKIELKAIKNVLEEKGQFSTT